MITLEDDRLVIRFPGISPEAGVAIDFQRTIRIPDDGQEHFLPSGLGRFPLRHIEDYDLGGSERRKGRGGLIMPMFQADALWLNFDLRSESFPPCPVALKIGAGKVNAVSGKRWRAGLSVSRQNYVVVPGQPWLDGFNTGKGVVRQFVAMPLGSGRTVEEQIDPGSDVGGLQIEAFPMKKEPYDRLKERHERILYQYSIPCSPAPEMGLGMGGAMRQEIYEDDHGVGAWDLDGGQRCFVMLANAEQWMDITGEEPPLPPVSAEEYASCGLPWFDYYGGDRKAIDGAKALGKIRTIRELALEMGEDGWPADGSVDIDEVERAVRPLGPRPWGVPDPWGLPGHLLGDRCRK